MKITPLTGHCGAEITEVDLRSLGESDIDEIDRAMTVHKVVAFRDQAGITPEQLLAVAACFGEPETAPHYRHRPVDGLAAVLRLVTDGKGFGGIVTDNWHTDRSPERETDFLSFLQAIDIPPYGRDTMFADMEAAYENLSAPIRDMLEGLTAIHSYPSDPTNRRSNIRSSRSIPAPAAKRSTSIRSTPGRSRGCARTRAMPFSPCSSARRMSRNSSAVCSGGRARSSPGTISAPSITSCRTSRTSG